MNTIALFNSKSPATSDVLVLDAILSEEHSLENKITEFPLETGANLNDHIVNSPRRFTLQGLITNTPLRGGKAPPGNYAEVAFQALEKLHTDRQLLTVVTRMKRYEGMAIEKLSIPRNPSTGEALEFTANLLEVKQVTSKTVIFQAKTTESPAAQPVNDKGKQPGSATSAKTSAQVASKAGKKQS